MTWEYGIMGLIIGTLMGIAGMKVFGKDMRKKKRIESELEKAKVELVDCRQKLTSHFAHSASLLDNMARDYRQLYQHMVKSSHELLPDTKNPFYLQLEESEVSSDQAPINIPHGNPERFFKGGASSGDSHEASKPSTKVGK